MSRTLLFAAAGCLMVLACRPATPSDVRRDLLGLWTTDATAYADRYFEFQSGDRLVLGSGPAGAVACTIRDLRVEQAGADVRDYALEYVDPSGVESVFRLRYSTREQTIRIRNQENVVWRRRVP